MRRLQLLAVALVLALPTGTWQARQKQPVERADQLPVHSYAVTKAPSALLHDEAALDALMAALRADLEADLAAYDIRDPAALRSYYRALGSIAMLQHRPLDALEYEDLARPLEEKPAARILSGLTLRPLVAAENVGAGEAAQVFSEALAAELARIPYDEVQAELKSMREMMGLFSPGFLEGRVASEIDVAARAGRISKEMALQLVSRSYALRRVLPYSDEIERQLSALIDAHHMEKPDIWAARDVSLDERRELTPVVVAIWDTGVDAALFAGRMWTNGQEIPDNGQDDDGNGHVDDVHGIAWSWGGEPRTGDLRAVELSEADLARSKQSINGFLDVQAGIDSEEARAVKRLLSEMSKDQVQPLIEGVQFYGTYAHGTHVAGIALRGNPAARVLSARFEAPYVMVPPPPTAAWAAGFARSLERTVTYFRKAGVRVVNMSWGMSAQQLEHDLEMNAVGATPQERHELALQSYGTVKAALGASLAAAPEILFVCAAGNSNESNQFNETVPAAFELPNTITVGAVDRAGDEAAFTSFGKVDLYANGHSVESMLPGGEKHSWSGTSMAAPQVVNLAAKLLAVQPQRSTVEIKELILDGADKKDVSGGRAIHLLNQARSFELLSKAGH